MRKVFKVTYEGDNPPTEREIAQALLDHEIDDEGREGVNIKYRERIKRKYRIRKWSDRADKWLAKQKEPVKVSFD